MSSKPKNRWSEWKWNESYNCYSRSKKSRSSKAVDGYEYEYKYEDTHDAEPRTNPGYNDGQSADTQGQEQASHEDNYTLNPSDTGLVDRGDSSYHDPLDALPGARVSSPDTSANQQEASDHHDPNVVATPNTDTDYHERNPDQPEEPSYYDKFPLDHNAFPLNAHAVHTEEQEEGLISDPTNIPPPEISVVEPVASKEKRYSRRPSKQSNVAAPPEQSVESITQGTSYMSIGRVDSSVGAHIVGRNTERHERFDKSYKLHKEYEFKQFRVFKVLWSEPQGGNGNGSHDTISVRETRNGPAHEKVRRFVIISPHRGHCLCLPINTYLKQGTMKSGVHAEHHTIVYTTRKPQYLPGEWEKGMEKTPIQIEASTPRDKLEPESRLNYAKVYTVEYNVKVCFLGKVDVRFRSQLVADYNRQHPRLTYGNNTQDSSYSQAAVDHTGSQWDNDQFSDYYRQGASHGDSRGHPGDDSRHQSEEGNTGPSRSRHPSHPGPPPNAFPEYQEGMYADTIREETEGQGGEGEESPLQDDLYSP